MTAITRQQVQAQYIQWDLDQMSNDQLRQYFVDSQNLHLNDLDDEELIEEVKHFAPHLSNKFNNNTHELSHLHC